MGKGARRVVWALVFSLAISVYPSSPALADGPGGKGPKGGPPIQEQAEEYDPGGGTSSSTTTSGGAFSCLYESRNPHYSTHIPGRVNAEGVTICTSPNPRVTVKAALYKEFAWLWWTKIAETPVASGFGSVNVFVNAACQGNLYYRIVTDHSDTGAWTNSGRTSNTQYVVCQ